MKRREALKSITYTTGMAMSASAFMSLLQSCQSKDPLTWTPEFMMEEEAYVVEKIVDMVIPRGDSVGALDLNIHIFLDSYMKECYTEGDVKKFRSGINVFMARFQESVGSVFSEASKEEKEKFIQDIYSSYNERAQELYVWIDDDRTPDAPQPGEEDEYNLVKFLIDIRQTTINAFFTTEKVGKEMLQYVPIPGKYKGCVEYNGSDPVWALS